MEEFRKINKQAIILDIVYWVLNFIVTPLVVLFIYIVFMEENGIIDVYASIFGDKSTDDGWEYLLFVLITGVTCIMIIILGILLINNVLLYLKFANDINLRQYIDNGDINSVLLCGRKYSTLINVSLNPFFAVPNNKMKAILTRYQRFNCLNK